MPCLHAAQEALNRTLIEEGKSLGKYLGKYLTLGGFRGGSFRECIVLLYTPAIIHSPTEKTKRLIDCAVHCDPQQCVSHRIGIEVLLIFISNNGVY